MSFCQREFPAHTIASLKQWRQLTSQPLTIINGILYQKWFEHCDHQTGDVVRGAWYTCYYDEPQEHCIVNSDVYQDSGSTDWGFDVWVAVDWTDDYMKMMRSKGYYKLPEPDLRTIATSLLHAGAKDSLISRFVDECSDEAHMRRAIEKFRHGSYAVEKASTECCITTAIALTREEPVTE